MEKKLRKGKKLAALLLAFTMAATVAVPADYAEAKAKNPTITLAVGDTLTQAYSAKIKSVKSSKPSIVSTSGKNKTESTIKAKKKGTSTIKIKFKKKKDGDKVYKYKSKTFDVKVVTEGMKQVKAPVVNNHENENGTYDVDVIFSIKNTGGICYKEGITFGFDLWSKSNSEEPLASGDKTIKRMVPGKTAYTMVSYKGLKEAVSRITVTGWESDDSAYNRYERKNQSKKVTATRSSNNSSSSTYIVKNASGKKVYGVIDYVFTNDNGRVIGVTSKTIKLAKDGQAMHQISKPEGTKKISVKRRAYSQKKITL